MKRLRSYLYTLAAVILVTVLIGLGALHRVDKWAQDWTFQKPGSASRDILVIGIDENALSELGPYNTWDRNVIASVLEALAADPDKKPAVTALDILYAGHSSQEADEHLASAAENLGNVITAAMAEYGEEMVFEDGRVTAVNSSAVVGYAQPYEELRACTTQGHINAMTDKDGVMRHALLYVEPDGEEDSRVYSMAYETARRYLTQHDQEVKLPTVNSAGHFYIPFTGRPGDYYDDVSVATILDGKVPPDYWADKIVLIGPYAAALQDAYFTSIDKGRQMYGVEIQANVIQSLLEGNNKTEVSDLLQLIILFVLGAAAMSIFLKKRVQWGGMVCAVLIVVCLAASVLLYKAGYVTHVLWFPAGLLALYILALGDHYIRMVRERQALALEKERIGAELALASRIQLSALPKDDPSFPERDEFELYASMTPAKEVGGDFYDYFLIDDDHLGLVIADVSDKGVPAALFMMVAMSLIRNAAMSAENECSPAKVLANVNKQLCSRNPEEMFVTVWLGILEISTGKLTASNAGHEHPAIKSAGGSFELLKDKHGFVLGGMDMMNYREYEVLLEPGSKLFVYTDGATEATNAQGEFFGAERIIDTLRACEERPASEIVKTVREQVLKFTGSAPQFDDLTMLCLDYYKGQVSSDS